jgi:hypothetical protein
MLIGIERLSSPRIARLNPRKGNLHRKDKAQISSPKLKLSKGMDDADAEGILSLTIE